MATSNTLLLMLGSRRYTITPVLLDTSNSANPERGKDT
jgi:hypothetical protein